MIENRIYVDGKLVNVCHSEYAFGWNYSTYKKLYGERVTIKRLDKVTNDKEKQEWLNSLDSVVANYATTERGEVDDNSSTNKTDVRST